VKCIQTPAQKRIMQALSDEKASDQPCHTTLRIMILLNHKSLLGVYLLFARGEEIFKLGTHGDKNWLSPLRLLISPLEFTTPASRFHQT